MMKFTLSIAFKSCCKITSCVPMGLTLECPIHMILEIMGMTDFIESVLEPNNTDLLNEVKHNLEI